MASLSRPETGGGPGVRTATSLWFPRPFGVELREERLPEVGPDEVRVRAVASALSHGSEMLVFRGQVPQDLALDLPSLDGSFGFPIKYGYASVGRVVETGDNVSSLQAGDPVFAHHPHQSVYVLASSQAVSLQPDLPIETGVFVASLETALNVMLDAGPRLCERVIIFGQGVIGLLLGQLARLAGAGLIIGVEPLRKRQELALAVGGVDIVVAPGDGLEDMVRDLTHGVGADLVLEASGSELALRQAVECAAFQGTVVVCSWYGNKQVTLGLGANFHRGRVRLVSSQVSSIDPSLQPRWDRRRRLEAVKRLLPALELEPLITHRIPFKRAAQAYDLVDRCPEETVQVLLTYGNDDV